MHYPAWSGLFICFLDVTLFRYVYFMPNNQMNHYLNIIAVSKYVQAFR